MITMRHARTVGHAMPELIHLRLAISAGVVQSLAVMGSTATGRIWLDAANDHCSNGEVDGGVVHPACNGRQMQADVVEQRYRRLVDHSPDAIAVHEGGRVVYINHAGVRWIGAQSSAELVGHLITEFVHPDSVPEMLARIASLRHEGDTSPPSEAVMLRLDGTTLEVEAVSVLTVWEGRPAYQVIFRDLSAQRAAEAAVHRQAALVNQVSDAIIATTFAGIVTNWNPAAEAIYRRPAARALTLPASEAVGAPLDPAAIIVHGGIVHGTHHAADGAALDVRVSATATDNGYVLVCTDRTALRRAEQHFQTVVTALDYGVAVVGSDGRVESSNPAADRIFGTAPEIVKNRPASRAFDFPIYDTNGHLIAADRHPLTQIRQTGTPISDYVFGADRSDGQRVWLCAGYRLLNPDDPQYSAVLISLTDVTAQRTASERLAYEATHDSLTGLPNRAHVVTRVTAALESDDHNVLAAVLFIDLDNLKTINDSLGHDAGDDVLRGAAQRLCRAVRADDVVARFGGDEFVALLIGQIARPDLDALAERLHASLSEPVVIEGVTLRIRASIGIVVIENNDPRAASQILRDADTAMYAAKTTGRGKSHYFTEQLQDRKRRHPANQRD
jgi:diguanylate cyclase (GGDEF)-like protein/PAS domain S-box-containing protein